jgi:hypothetical protein
MEQIQPIGNKKYEQGKVQNRLIGQKAMKINCRLDGKIEKLVSTIATILKNGIGKF